MYPPGFAVHHVNPQKKVSIPYAQIRQSKSAYSEFWSPRVIAEVDDSVHQKVAKSMVLCALMRMRMNCFLVLKDSSKIDGGRTIELESEMFTVVQGRSP
jgi:hypothetical protein